VSRPRSGGELTQLIEFSEYGINWWVMEPITIEIDIDRPPAEVFDYAADPMHFPEWQKDIVAVKIVSGAPGRAGSRFETIRHFAGANQTMTQEVTEANPPLRWSSRGINGAVKANGTLSFQPLDGARRSHVTFSITFESGLLGRAIIPLVVRQTKAGAPKSFQRLKEILEKS
jgi:uncharacterized membrane protein